MKYLEVRITVPEPTDNKKLEELGEYLQEIMPCEFECNDILVEDVTFEVKVFP